MCVKLPPGDLNPDPCPPHPTSIYTCGVTTAPRVCGGIVYKLLETVQSCVRCNTRKLALELNRPIYININNETP